MTNPYAEVVARGEAWLDEHYPDWVKVFAADRAAGLHMESCHQCVLGHVLGHYSVAFRRHRDFDSHGLGFNIPAHEDDPAWDVLGEAWKDVIEKRLANAGLLA